MSKHCICLALCVAHLFVCSPANADQTITESTADDQVSLKITIYNNNLGLIKETRKVELPAGEGLLRFVDIPSHIIPTSVHAKSQNNHNDFSVLEQNYEYDLINENKLLDKYVGKKIKIINFNEYQDRKEIIEATLLSNNQGQIYKINNEIYLGYPGYKILPELPENLAVRPAITWLYNNKGPKTHNLEVSYLTVNINWKADYVVVLGENDTSADVSAWVSLDNKTGTTYKEAALKLVAGEVHRAQKKQAVMAYEMMATDRARPSQFEGREFSEYHVYDLKRKTTIYDNRTKQVSLFEAFDVGVHKEFIISGAKNYFIRPYRKSKQPVHVYIKFQNSKDNNLGMPLPAGIMRLYKKDDDKSAQFIGEDKIDHTPTNEEVRLKIGEPFDVVAERVQTAYKKISTRLYESDWEITVKNHKEQDITVGIEESLYDNWEVITHSHPYKKINAFKIQFTVNVPRNEQVKVKYRIRVGL